MNKLKFTKKTIKRASLIAFSISLIGFFFLVKKHLIISYNPFAITIQICAVIIMIWARITFGMRSFHANANSTKGELVTNGPYKLFRHPIYASIIYFFLACIIAFPKIETIIGVFLIVSSTYVRMILEEISLRETYKEYNLYSQKAKRIIPFLF
ncbi:methyltransferase family protein [Lutibacter citreus]|uniref:methyltransferase family protein n=1 Tax=Lutibacter citreus TaxID=2138210 RepID=UPI0013002A04|nr:methyltransferase [Lutibacter citreus]